MLGWNQKAFDCTGSVFFRGSMPPRLQNFTQLEQARIAVELRPETEGAHWSADLVHPQWGSATAVCLRDFTPIPRVLFDHDPRLTDADRSAIHSAGSEVSIIVSGPRKNVLRDRKFMLRFLRLLMGDDGLVVIDHMAQKFWSRECLDEELAHDADLDVDSLFVTHSVTSDELRNDPEPRAEWLHTHGLAKLGALDFDIIRPSPLLLGPGYDAVRAMAYIALERGPKLAGDTIHLISPGGDFRMVPVEDFNRTASDADRAPRGDPMDPFHNLDRVILCEPARRRLFGLLSPAATRSSRFLSTVNTDRFTAAFPNVATNLMSERARQTFHLFRAFISEFEEFESKPLVKLGYQVDGGSADEREHMWFEVHSCGEDFVDATLLNEPFHIAGMKVGQRSRHPITLLTDWSVFTPLGQIHPRSMTLARVIREKKTEIRQLIAEAGSKDSPTN